ncbi:MULTISPECIES: glycosyltransferase family 4 protein [unclassified Haematobacter]|uniref:glycosyltransferase family 4 protein n=1 Tax=unclassified Haematobacter TaxID=2640585 RepID=UPI0025BD33A1|nr:MULTISPECIES: glycosyltransferase family 4 protein [unclassified Haematobacter]
MNETAPPVRAADDRMSANETLAAMAAAEAFPQPHPGAGVIRILWVFAWLVVGGEETEVRLMARHLDPRRYRIVVLPCFRKEGMPEQTHQQLLELGVEVDTRAYEMSFEDTVSYLRLRMADADIVISSQNVADIYPALEGMARRPPLIEHGGLVEEALAGPKHFTSRYVGVCQSIRDAAAARMPGREGHALEIPSMVDLTEFGATALAAGRARLRKAFGIAEGEVLIGWIGRLDRKKRVEDFIEAARLSTAGAGGIMLRFMVVGGPDAFMPDYEQELHRLAARAGLTGRLFFTGDRKDIPDLLAAMDVLCWLSRGEGMPHVIAEAGAAGLPVIATPDNGALQQIVDGASGIFVPHEEPAELARQILRLAREEGERKRLGSALRRHVHAAYSVSAVLPQWERLFTEVLEGVPPAPDPSTFKSFILGGWESSTHRRRDGKRLDLIADTGHDADAAADYRQLAALGIRSCRDALRWHLVETAPGHHDFSSFLPMLHAARDTGTQVVWDLLHYGWPDDLDIWAPEFVTRFARFARAAARLMRDETDAAPFWCPVNEISFLSWAGGDARYLNPFAAGRGFELKVQLARAALAAMAELRAADPRARFLTAEPLIAVHHDPAKLRPYWEARGHHEAQFQAFDLLSGRLWPQIGGAPEFLDLVGVNYYCNNQWIHAGPVIDVDHPAYRPLSDLLFDVSARYDRPIVVAETGTEGNRRGPWCRYIREEVVRARQRGIPAEGVCFYPIADHKGWDDERICPNGLLGYRRGQGGREVNTPFMRQIEQKWAV